MTAGGDHQVRGYSSVGPMAPFYVFPCGHAFHAQCLIAHVTRCTDRTQVSFTVFLYMSLHVQHISGWYQVETILLYFKQGEELLLVPSIELVSSFTSSRVFTTNLKLHCKSTRHNKIVVLFVIKLSNVSYQYLKCDWLEVILFEILFATCPIKEIKCVNTLTSN